VRTTTIAIVLAFGDIYERGGEGNIILPIDGVLSRLQATVAGLDPASTIAVVCTAGYSRKSPTRSIPQRRVSLAGQLRRYMVDHAKGWVPKLFAEPLCWSTENEIRTALRLAREQFGIQGTDQLHIVTASHWAHVPRIHLFLYRYRSAGWTHEVRVARHRFGAVNYLIEPIKLVRDLVSVLLLRR
jgi:hypothetical protein